MKEQNKAQLTQEDELKLKAFALANELALETARKLLENLSKQEEYDKNAEKYIWESDNEDLKQFEAGRRTGFKEGKEVGVTRGRIQSVATLLFSGMFLLGLKYYENKIKNL